MALLIVSRHLSQLLLLVLLHAPHNGIINGGYSIDRLLATREAYSNKMICCLTHPPIY